MALLGSLLSLMSHSTRAADTAYVTVNGVPISQEVADFFITQATSHGMPISPSLKDQVKEELIRRELLWQEARKAGIDKKSDVAARAEAEKKKILIQADTARQTIFVRAYIEDYLKKHPASDAVLQDEYRKQRARGGDTDFKLRHILLRNDKDARAIVARLDKGAKFEEMALQSLDPASKENGGDLGWVVPSKFAKPFADAVTSLKPGKHTRTPVRTELGYHVIKLDDTRPLAVPSFEEMKPLLRRQIEEATLRKLVDDLRMKAKIE